MQLKIAAATLIFHIPHFVLRYGPFCAAKQAIPSHKMCRFGERNGTFYNLLTVNPLAMTAIVTAFNMKMLTAAYRFRLLRN